VVALGGTLAYISPGTSAYWAECLIPIQVCSSLSHTRNLTRVYLVYFPYIITAARQSKRDVSIAVAKEKRELAMEIQTMRDESFAAVMKDTTVRKLAGLKELAQQGADHKMKLQQAREHAASLRARQHALDEKVDRLAARYVTSGKFSPGKAQDEAEARYAAEAVEPLRPIHIGGNEHIDAHESAPTNE
jgi:hypothetical protein